MTKPAGIVGIVGCPNVGKSTLFNRIIGKRRAVTSEQPGVTRDRHYARFTWQGITFLLVDTGGYIPGAKAGVDASIRSQTEEAISQADLILFMVDGKVGITSEDQEVRNLLVKSKKPVLLVVSKIDRKRDEMELSSFYRLGLGDPIGVSGLSGRGTGDLLDRIIENLPEPEEYDIEENLGVPIAIIGRPNVGKSSFANAILRSERHIVHEKAGTTRDSIDSPIIFNGERVILIDTAGIRRVVKIRESIEYYSYLRTMKSIDRCDVAIVLFDTFEGLIAGDIRILDDVVQAGKGLVIAANKWDLIKKDMHTSAILEKAIRKRIPDKAHYPITFISAKHGQRVEKTIEKALEIHKIRSNRVQTADLNRFMKTIKPPAGSSRVKINYAVQSSTNPPEFVFFVNITGKIRPDYSRYLERSLRETFQFEGTPLRIIFRKKH